METIELNQRQNMTPLATGWTDNCSLLCRVLVSIMWPFGTFWEHRHLDRDGFQLAQKMVSVSCNEVAYRRQCSNKVTAKVCIVGGMRAVLCHYTRPVAMLCSVEVLVFLPCSCISKLFCSVCDTVGGVNRPSPHQFFAVFGPAPSGII